MAKNKVYEQLAPIHRWLHLQKTEVLRETRPCRLRGLVFLGGRLELLQRWLAEKTDGVQSALRKAEALEYAEREARWGYTANEEAFQAREQEKLDQKDALTISAPQQEQPEQLSEAAKKLRASEAPEEVEDLELVTPAASKTTLEELFSTLGRKNSSVVHLLTGKAKGRYDALGRLARQEGWRVTQLPLAEAPRKLHLLSNSFRNRDLGAGGPHVVLVDAREATPEALGSLIRPLRAVDSLELLRVVILLAPGTAVPKELAAIPAASF